MPVPAPDMPGMLKFFIILRGTMSMPKETDGAMKEMESMGAMIWGLFILLVTVVLERESFFS